MPITGDPRVYLDAPSPPKVVGGILAWARVIDASSDPHQLMGARYQTLMCKRPTSYSQNLALCDYKSQTFCNPGGTQLPKDFSIVPGSTISTPQLLVTAGMECMYDQDEQVRQLRELLDYTEDREVEKYIQYWLDTWSTSLGSFDIVGAVARMEQYLDETYAGMGVMHMSRATALRAMSEHLLFQDLDGRLRTINGTRVVNGRGYYTTPLRIYGTGEVTLIKGPLEVHAVPPATWTESSTVKCEPARVLAERIWLAMWDCDSSVVTVTP